MGGYVAALLCGLEESGVDCVIAANPSVDPSKMFWRDGLPMATRYLKTAGVTQKKTDVLLDTVSLLALKQRVSWERRACSPAWPTASSRPGNRRGCGVIGNVPA